MANRDSADGFRSISGQGETEEPLNNNGANMAAAATNKEPTAQKTQPSQPPTATSSSSSSAPTLRKASSTTLAPQVSSPLAQSPRTSRNASPIRKDKPPPASSTLSSQPSAAAIQRALSASSVPQLPQQGSMGLETASRIPRGNKSATASGDTTPSWPLSPRLKSPPPSGPNSRRSSAATQKRSETPSIQVLSATPQNNTAGPQTMKQMSSDNSRADPPQLQPPPQPKPSARGASGKSTLETVQENSSDSQEPSPAAIQAAADLRPLTKISEDEIASSTRDSPKTDDPKPESGSESAGNKSDANQRGREDSTSHSATSTSQAQRPRNASKNTFSSSTTKSRQGDGKQNMTVETETVQSIPQSGLAPASESSSRLRTDNGSVKLKPSNETIRPKKERKKAERKTRSVNQGSGRATAHDSPSTEKEDATSYPTERSVWALSIHLKQSLSFTSRNLTDEKHDRAMVEHFTSFCLRMRCAIPFHNLRIIPDKTLHKAASKADLFEARVANYVEEANTSDSDETFVYESNPPEPQRRQRHHSRTPSVTSSHSMAEGQRSGIRNYGDTYDDRRVGGKRSMKFSSNPYTDVDSPESKDGTVRSHTPRHIGRFGRGGHHSATYDHQDSPFTQASKLRQNQLQRSRPNSPKSPQSMQFRSGGGLFSSNRKQEHPYDFDTEQNADDERTPLMGTVRGPRGFRNARRMGSSTVQSLDDYAEERRGWRWFRGRTGSCLLTSFVVLLVIFSAVAFVVASNRSLADVELRKIKNVLASEEELMLDLVVGAINPNALSVSVSDMDINIFAKSKHVDTVHPPGSSGTTRRRASREINPNPSQDPSGHWNTPDTSDDVERDAQTMLLGRIFHFDQALTFDASPIRQHAHFSSGQVRLMKPGNETETGGSARWEKMIQGPFELFVRGVLKYQLPVSSRQQRAALSGSVVVHPEEGIDEKGNMRVEPIDHSEHWQWIDWPEVLDEDDESEETRGSYMEEVD